jgi:hypothetical protein
MHSRSDVDATLGVRKVAVAQEHQKAAAERLTGAQRDAEVEGSRDEEEHRRNFRHLHKLRGAEGERQRVAAAGALEMGRVLRQHCIASAQQRAQQADERSRETVHAAEAARKQRDSLGGWRDHVRHAAEGLARAAAHGEDSGHRAAHASTAAALFRNNRHMFCACVCGGVAGCC